MDTRMKCKNILRSLECVLRRFYFIVVCVWSCYKLLGLFLKLTECYKAVCNWTDLIKWKEKEAELWMHQNGGTPQKYVSFSENS
jgi:hypothetical protein